MHYDTSPFFCFFLQELTDYETVMETNPLWQNAKKEYYKGYCSLMGKVHQLTPGTGFHIWSTKAKEYADDNFTLLLNPDIDALMTFCMSLHEDGIHTQWTCNETHWIVFVYKK